MWAIRYIASSFHIMKDITRCNDFIEVYSISMVYDGMAIWPYYTMVCYTMMNVSKV